MGTTFAIVVEKKFMKLGEMQRHLGAALPVLELYMQFQGYQLVSEDAYRNPTVYGKFGEKKFYAARYSVHKLKLARDYSVFKDGVYLTKKKANVAFSMMHDLADTMGLAKRIPGDLGHFSMQFGVHR